MSIKSIALVAATIAGTASFASAESYFQFNDTIEDTSVLELGLVRAESAGVVEVYDYARGEIGALIGSEQVRMGANSDVRVNAPIRPTDSVIALLKVDGETVAQRTYDLAN